MSPGPRSVPESSVNQSCGSACLSDEIKDARKSQNTEWNWPGNWLEFTSEVGQLVGRGIYMSLNQGTDTVCPLRAHCGSLLGTTAIA